MRPMDVTRFAEQAIAHIARNRDLIILPRSWKIAHWMDRLTPSIMDRVAVRVSRHARNEYDRMRGDG